MISKKVKAAVLAGVLTLSAVTGAFAYFSGLAEKKENNFNIVMANRVRKTPARLRSRPGIRITQRALHLGRRYRKTRRLLPM